MNGTRGNFYEEDEPMDDVRNAWLRGARGKTEGARRARWRDRWTVARAMRRFERRPTQFVVVSTTSNAPTIVTPPLEVG